MVEPLEETRTELVFATEPVLSSLEQSIPGSGKHASLVELDEVEVRLCSLPKTPVKYSLRADPKRYTAAVQGIDLPP